MTILVGKNNAGKSTVAEALRLISLVTRRHDRLPFKRPPDEFQLPIRSVGIAPALAAIEIEYKTLFHRYGEPPAEVVAKFANGTSIHVYVSTERIHQRASVGRCESGREADCAPPSHRLLCEKFTEQRRLPRS
jgi:hypothetical protein